MDKQNHKRKRRISVTLIILLIAAIGIGAYLLDYYPPSETAVNQLEELTDSVQIVRGNNMISFVPDDARIGIIFYPGGKVAYESYAPLMELCGENGILCVLLHMPANLAVLDQNAAEGIRELYPQVQKWYLAGHSLGGTVAAIYLSDHAKEFEGLILLASYSTADLSDTKLKVLSVYGSEDGVLNRKAYEENRDMLPEDYKEVIIEGGCHAYFGSYGEQSGDGTPTITPQEQQRQTAQEIINFLFP